MKRTATIFLFALAMLFVLGHAMFPHTHFLSDKLGISVESPHSLADIIKCAFSNNLGAEHLKIFKNCNQPNLFNSVSHETSAILYGTRQTADLSSGIVESIMTSQEINNYQPAVVTLSLRAPPHHF